MVRSDPFEIFGILISCFLSSLTLTSVSVVAILFQPTRALFLLSALSIRTCTSSLYPSLSPRCSLHSSTMSSITLSDCITPSRSSIIPNPFGATTKKGKSKVVDKSRGQDGEIVLPDYISPPPKDSREKREWDRMSTRMEGFHSYCTLNGNSLNFHPKSLRKQLTDFVSFPFFTYTPLVRSLPSILPLLNGSPYGLQANL